MTDNPNVKALDPSRRYLRPVAPLPLPGVEDVTHWSVYQWLPMFEAWATGMSLCGASMRQGPLPEGTTVTCEGCEAYRPEYERMLAPGYRPEDDDLEALRKRAETAEGQVRQAQALAAKWHEVAASQSDAVILAGVAGDVLLATLNGFNDLTKEVQS
ncbi:hypothetical protein OIE75_41030 (plasmid) [Streptomyces sp. NBC_01723]|uniref:hypothetical protein n=1 Tax=Streptomyces sp. NBC_01723 TaxID=2975921 RepID=UPI002E3742E6|nr:hypothetical protein [Streptomyces sp. NBC_01723]